MERLLNIKDYWSDIDIRLEALLENGYVKLPSIKDFGLGELADKIFSEMDGGTFAELCPSHELFIEQLSMHKYLSPKLFNLAKEKMGFKGDLSNQYHIARLVEPGNSKEMYRAHFDSHIFTMVLPIKIPTSQKDNIKGDLIYFPNSRKAPKNEVSNFIGKAYHKRFASKEGVKRYATNHKKLTDDFLDYSPLLFIGNTTLHTNKPVSLDCSSYRLTLLAHFFDPSPKYGIGGALRLVRKR